MSYSNVSDPSLSRGCLFRRSKAWTTGCSIPPPSHFIAIYMIYSSHSVSSSPSSPCTSRSSLYSGQTQKPWGGGDGSQLPWYIITWRSTTTTLQIASVYCICLMALFVTLNGYLWWWFRHCFVRSCPLGRWIQIVRYLGFYITSGPVWRYEWDKDIIKRKIMRLQLQEFEYKNINR